MRLVFPEVRLTAVRIVWQPPEEPNGVILGKEPWWGGGSGGQGELSSPVSVRQWWWTQITAAASPGHRASRDSFVPVQGTETFSWNEIYILLTQNSLHLFAIHGTVRGEPIRNRPPSAPGSADGCLGNGRLVFHNPC